MKGLTHEACAHFKDGFCSLYGIPVSPDQPACPNFTPKNASTPPTFYQPQPSPSFRLGWRLSRGAGRRRRLGFQGRFKPSPQLSSLQEQTLLREGLKALEEQLRWVKRRLEELRRF